MSRLLEFKTDLETMLSSANLSDFFDDDMKIRWINLAGRRVCNFTAWDWLKEALETDTEVLQEWYKVPDQFKRNSVFRITVEDEAGVECEYDIVPWNLYKEHRAAGGSTQVASILKDQYFLYPTPTVNDLEIGVYGQLKWLDLADDADESITPEETDEAILKLAYAEALRKESRFDEATSLVSEVTQEILPRLLDNQSKTPPGGFVGTVKTSRWSN